MKVPVAPHTITARHETIPTMDEDLMEALGYFSEEVATSAQVPSSPLVVGIGSPSKLNEAESTDETMDAMLLSLEIQELLSPDEQDKVLPMPDETVDKRTTSVSDSSAGKQQGPKKIDRRLRPFSTAKRRNRKRPKHELEYLRGKVVELQEELESLGSKPKVGSPNAVGEELTLATIDSTTSWKAVAQRQRQEAENSIAENRRLRNRLLGQLQVARVLEAAINQHQRETGVSAFNGVGWPQARAMTNQQIFAQLNDYLKTQFTEVNRMLTTSGLSNVFHQLCGGFDFKRQDNGITFRHEETRLLPFSVQTLHNTIWNCLHNGSVVEQTQSQRFNQDHSNLIFRETIELSKSYRVKLTKCAAFRRHIEKDRVVFVWNSYVHIDGSVSVRLREKGWSTCSTFEYHRDVNTGATGSSNFVQGCMARMAIQLIPEVPQFQSEHEAQQHIGEMTDLIIGTYRHNFGLIHEVVEKVLLGSNSTIKDKEDGEGVVCDKVVTM